MTYHDEPLRMGAGPFGYTLDDLASRTPDERGDMLGELEEVENNLQWGYEPGRWADGAEYYRNAWPQPKLLGADAFASSFDQRDGLRAETADFRTMLGDANKVWKTEAGRNSPFLLALAALPKYEQKRVRNQSGKFRTLIAYGETPDRWEREVNNLAEAGDLLDPTSDSQRLIGLWETKDDLVPQLDSIDHALDYLGELEREGESPHETPALVLSGSAGQDTALRSAAGLPAIGETLNADAPTVDGVANTPVNPDQPPQVLGGANGGALDTQGGSIIPADLTTPASGLRAPTPGTTPSGIGATVNSGIGAANPPVDSAGALDETRFVAGQTYRMPDGSAWRWSGHDLTPADPRAGAPFAPASPDPDAALITDPDERAEYTGLNAQIAETEAKVAADEALADAREEALRREGVSAHEAARATGKWREEARSAAHDLAAKRAQQAEFEEAMNSRARDTQVAAILQANLTTQTPELSETLRGGSPSGTGTPAGFQTVSVDSTAAGDVSGTPATPRPTNSLAYTQDKQSRQAADSGPDSAGAPVETPFETFEHRARNAEGLSGRELHGLMYDITTSRDLTMAHKAQLNNLAAAANSGKLSPRETPRAEDSAQHAVLEQRQQPDYLALAPETEIASLGRFTDKRDQARFAQLRSSVNNQRLTLWSATRERERLNQQLKRGGKTLPERLKILREFDRDKLALSGSIAATRRELSEIVGRADPAAPPRVALEQAPEPNQPVSAEEPFNTAMEIENTTRNQLTESLARDPRSFRNNVFSQDFMRTVPKLVQANIDTTSRNVVGAYERLERVENERQVALEGHEMRKMSLVSRNAPAHELEKLAREKESIDSYYDKRTGRIRGEIDSGIAHIAGLVGQFTDPAYKDRSSGIAATGGGRSIFGVGDDSYTGLALESGYRGLSEADVSEGGRRFFRAALRAREADSILATRREEHAELTRLLEGGTPVPGFTAAQLQRQIAGADREIRWLEGEVRIAENRKFQGILAVAAGLRKLDRLAPSPATEHMRRAMEEGSGRLALDFFLQDPGAVITEMASEYVGGEVVGETAGFIAETTTMVLLPESVLTKVLAFGTGSLTESFYSAYKEYGSAVVAKLESLDADFSDPASVAEVLAKNRKEIWEFARDQAEISGLATFIGNVAGEASGSYPVEVLATTGAESALGKSD